MGVVKIIRNSISGKCLAFIFFGLLFFIALNSIYPLSTPLGYLVNTTMSVSINPEINHIFFEYREEDTGDHIFQIGPLIDDGNWYSYNGSYGGIYSGYEIGVYSGNDTNLFIIKNTGSETIDIFISSSDFDNGIVGDSNHIDVNRSFGNFQIFIPGDGWRNVPDNSEIDEDNYKNTEELCIVNDLAVGSYVDGFDFQIRSQPGTDDGNYTANIVVSVFESDIIDYCSGAGEYVDI